jgi:hypothetical protein
MFVLTIVCSCTPLIKLKVNNQESINIKFDCGKATVTAYLLPDHIGLNIKFNVKSELTIFRNNLIIKKNDVAMDLTVYDSHDRKIEDNIFYINNESEISIYFSPADWFNEGDSITVYADNFIICNGKPLSLPLLKIGIEDLLGK